uniref:Uncharacterized protein n=1 Tax=Solanum tuberosum TaxID=4113 RepID=M1DHF7_SOLTU
MHKEYKGADKGRTGSLSARRRMRLATSCFSPKVTEFNITFSIDIKGDVGQLGETLSGSASSSQLTKMAHHAYYQPNFFKSVPQPPKAKSKYAIAKLGSDQPTHA